MPTGVDKDAISELYEAVRDDNNDTTWLTVKRDGQALVVDASGSDYEQFLNTIVTDDECKFGYLRVTTGDELSKRAKFVFITWSAPGASPLKRAKLSVDKTTLKSVIKSFAVEILSDEKSELSLENVSATVRKAGGANYGTGK